jgi:hypothetical protein
VGIAARRAEPTRSLTQDDPTNYALRVRALRRLRLAAFVTLATAAIAAAAAARGKQDTGAERFVVTTSTTIEDWWVYATFGVSPTRALKTLRVSIQFFDHNYGGYFYLSTADCEVLQTGASLTYEGHDFVFDFSNVPGRFSRSQNLLRCNWYSHYPAEAAESDWFSPWLSDARDDAGAEVATDFCMTHLDVDPLSPEPDRDLCGDTDSDGALVAGDALRILTTAVGGGSCPRCDVDNSGSVSPTDALAVLQAAVGLTPPLLCAVDCRYF